jgi:hypothetical protein
MTIVASAARASAARVETPGRANCTWLIAKNTAKSTMCAQFVNENARSSASIVA